MIDLQKTKSKAIHHRDTEGTEKNTSIVNLVAGAVNNITTL